MKVTMCQLINLIGNLKPPYKIKFKDVIYELDDSNYYSDTTEKYLFSVINDEYFDTDIPKLEFEILPEETDEWKNIEEINHNGKQIYNPKTSAYNTLNSKEKNIFIPAINQLIKNQKYLKEKLESKDE